MQPVIGVYLSNNINKRKIIEQILKNELLIDYIDLAHRDVRLFSQITIEKIIENEIRHDHFPVKTAENGSLQSMSSGQQRKALLSYLLDLKPDCLILDDIYGNLDVSTQEYITKTLHTRTEGIAIIQIFMLKRDLLPFVDTVVEIKHDFSTCSYDAATFTSMRCHEEMNENEFLIPGQYSSNNLESVLIQLNSISTSYGDKEVLKDVNWTIRKGEFWQLCGPNGSGKSTLISLITGDNPRAYTQNMYLFGRKKGSGETIWDIRKHIGYFTPNMLSQFTRDDSVENMILSGLKDSIGLYSEPTDMQRDLARDWIKLLGKTIGKNSFQSLTEGQKRMVMVARAMIKLPSLLILDEPTIELDENNAMLFAKLINTIAGHKQTAIIYVSHRVDEHIRPEFRIELVKSGRCYTSLIHSSRDFK